MEIKGVMPIIGATFSEDEKVDYDSLGRELRYLKASGCDGATLFGIAGEYYKLTDTECEEMIRFCSDECRKIGLPLIISCTPHFMKPGGKEMIDHIEKVANSVSLPVMLQYAPEQTGVTMAPELLAALSKNCRNLSYFKIECKPAGPYITQLLEKTGTGTSVFAGNAGYQMIEVYDRGAAGVMPGASMAKLYVAIDRAYRSGDREKAIDLHTQLLSVLNHIRQNVEMIIHFEKEIMYRQGIIASRVCRHPEFNNDERMDLLFDDFYERIKTYL